MRRYDLLDEYATLIAPSLGPQARSRLHPAGKPRRPLPRPPLSKLWPAPAALLAVGIVLLAVF